jgi:ribosomal protein S8
MDAAARLLKALTDMGVYFPPHWLNKALQDAGVMLVDNGASVAADHLARHRKLGSEVV